ncbi:MAG: hypothetical protein GY816_21155 [Cytophagales bacterium]|nr:hypothetical protein [Cytophagales bacterium]
MKIGGNSNTYTNGVAYQDFSQGLTIFAVPMTSESITRHYVPPTQVGALSLLLEFETPLTDTTIVHVVGCYPEEINLHPMSKMITSSFYPGSFG